MKRAKDGVIMQNDVLFIVFLVYSQIDFSLHFKTNPCQLFYTLYLIYFLFPVITIYFIRFESVNLEAIVHI